MSDNPYAPPDSTIVPLPPVPAEAVPDSILKKIRGAGTAGVISAVFTLLFPLLLTSSDTGTEQMADPYIFVDVAILVALVFGMTKRKSRVCAILLLAYYLFSKIVFLAEVGFPGLMGIVVPVIFIVYFFQGVIGTFQYHQFLRQQRAGLLDHS